MKIADGYYSPFTHKTPFTIQWPAQPSRTVYAAPSAPPRVTLCPSEIFQESIARRARAIIPELVQNIVYQDIWSKELVASLKNAPCEVSQANACMNLGRILAKLPIDVPTAEFWLELIHESAQIKSQWRAYFVLFSLANSIASKHLNPMTISSIKTMLLREILSHINKHSTAYKDFLELYPEAFQNPKRSRLSAQHSAIAVGLLSRGRKGL